MNNFREFLRSKGRELCKDAVRIFAIVPILVTVIIIFAAWLTLRLKGRDFSIDQMNEVLPTIILVSLLVTAGAFVNMFANEWQKYKRSLEADR